MFHLEPVTISTHYRQLFGSHDAIIGHVFLHLVAKMNDLFLEQRINIKFCVKLGKNASDTYAVLFKAYAGEGMKKSNVSE
jgi:hypothetical protein